jgi:hypothetical protein
VISVTSEKANQPPVGINFHPASISMLASSAANDMHSWSSVYVVISKACGAKRRNASDICFLRLASIERKARRVLSSNNDLSASACPVFACAKSVSTRFCVVCASVTSLPSRPIFSACRSRMILDVINVPAPATKVRATRPTDAHSNNEFQLSTEERNFIVFCIICSLVVFGALIVALIFITERLFYPSSKRDY